MWEDANATSFFRPYLDMLPQSFDTPLFWTRDQVSITFFPPSLYHTRLASLPPVWLPLSHSHYAHSLLLRHASLLVTQSRDQVVISSQVSFDTTQSRDQVVISSLIYSFTLPHAPTLLGITAPALTVCHFTTHVHTLSLYHTRSPLYHPWLPSFTLRPHSFWFILIYLSLSYLFFYFLVLWFLLFYSFFFTCYSHQAVELQGTQLLERSIVLRQEMPRSYHELRQNKIKISQQSVHSACV